MNAYHCPLVVTTGKTMLALHPKLHVLQTCLPAQLDDLIKLRLDAATESVNNWIAAVTNLLAHVCGLELFSSVSFGRYSDLQ